MGDKVSALKKEGGEIFKNIISKLTPKQGKIASLVVSAGIALLFLCTSTGRSLIGVLGYLLFIYCILVFGYRLYKFATAYAVAIPKPKTVKPADEATDEPNAEDDSCIEMRQNGDNGAAREATEVVHQMTIEEIGEQVEDDPPA